VCAGACGAAEALAAMKWSSTVSPSSAKAAPAISKGRTPRGRKPHADGNDRQGRRLFSHCRRDWEDLFSARQEAFPGEGRSTLDRGQLGLQLGDPPPGRPQQRRL
jgi:hypothetical protein